MLMLFEMEFLYFFILSIFIQFTDANLSKRFEYKHSFKGPHLVQKDRTVPFWTYVGNAIASDDFVRLAPSLKSQRGLIWNKLPVEFPNWEVELTFKVAGRGRIGADGLAFWYTTGNEALTGPVFGAQDNWNGLGVFFDSFDNDGGSNNPYISAHLNDGTKKFDHQTDGNQNQLGGCMRDYRNKPFATKAKVRYENKVLSMFLSSGLTKPTAVEDGAEHLYDLCAYIPNVELPGSGHFGVSAATGALADDHDIISFMAHSLRTEEEMKSKQAIADEERAKYDKEFEEYDKQLNEAKTEYQKENPEANAKEDEEEEFYDTGVKELKMIFDGQDHIHQSINAINRRLNELIGTSQQLATQIGQLAQQGAGVQQAGQVPAQPPATGTGTPAIQRHEVDHLIRNGNDLVQQLNQLKNSVEGIAREKRDAPPAPPSYEDQAGTQLIKNNVDEMKTILKQMQADAYVNSQKGGGASSCPEVSCLSTTYFGVFIVGQVVLLLLYSVYQSRKEAAAKKFY